MLQKKRVISIDVSIGEPSVFINEILRLATNKESSYICLANVHMTIEAYNNKNFQKIVNNANLVLPDGMPIVKALKLLYGIKQERISGPDLMPALIKEAENRMLSIYFYGSTWEVLQAIKRKIEREHPKLKIAGMFSPPFRKLNQSEKKKIINIINNSGAHIVFVSLGCPKQELWMAEMKGKINAVMIGVGAAFPIYAGLRTRAPKWMQKLSLEWFYRLLQEPRRLFKRYLYTNTKFIFLLIREVIRRKLKNA